MSMDEQIKILCVKSHISASELARRIGTTPQNFSQRAKKARFTPEELRKIAKAVGCTYESSFILPNGDKVVD